MATGINVLEEALKNVIRVCADPEWSKADVARMAQKALDDHKQERGQHETLHKQR